MNIFVDIKYKNMGIWLIIQIVSAIILSVIIFRAPEISNEISE
jgi:hypothetical protein